MENLHHFSFSSSRIAIQTSCLRKFHESKNRTHTDIRYINILLAVFFYSKCSSSFRLIHTYVFNILPPCCAKPGSHMKFQKDEYISVLVLCVFNFNDGEFILLKCVNVNDCECYILPVPTPASPFQQKKRQKEKGMKK